MESQKESITTQEARAKIQHYCAYQERAQQEVRDKLYDLGLHRSDVEQLISELIAENFLNEERFALAYAGGKFRLKRWGRLKIQAGLKARQVSEKLIRKALAVIDQDDYEQGLEDLLEKKIATLGETDSLRLRQKLLNYAAAKGYEKNLILNSLAFNNLKGV